MDSTSRYPSLGIIAGSGRYPFLVARAARAAGVPRIVAAAFEGETDPKLEELVNEIHWMRVGQLGKLLKVMKGADIRHAMMAGQIHPKNLFDLRPDFRALMILGRLRERNAESLFGAIAQELEKVNTTLLPAVTFLEEDLAPIGHFGGPKPNQKLVDEIDFGTRIAKETSRLDIGQSVVVRRGTVLAVEAFEGTNAAILRGGELAGPKGGVVLVKVSKPNQDLRFDVPVIGPETIEVAAQSRLKAIAVESGLTLILDRQAVLELAKAHSICMYGIKVGPISKR